MPTVSTFQAMSQKLKSYWIWTCILCKRMCILIVRHAAKMHTFAEAFDTYFTIKYGGLPLNPCPLDDLSREGPIFPLKLQSWHNKHFNECRMSTIINLYSQKILLMWGTFMNRFSEPTQKIVAQATGGNNKRIQNSAKKKLIHKHIAWLHPFPGNWNKTLTRNSYYMASKPAFSSKTLWPWQTKISVVQLRLKFPNSVCLLSSTWPILQDNISLLNRNLMQ